jgi:hypothetical protein
MDSIHSWCTPASDEQRTCRETSECMDLWTRITVLFCDKLQHRKSLTSHDVQMLRKIHLLVHDDPQIIFRAYATKHSSKLYRIACSQECYSFTFIDVKEQLIRLAPLGQFFQIRLNFHTVLKTLWRENQLHIIVVQQHTDVVKNHRYSFDKPNKTQWSEMWDTRCHPDKTQSGNFC